MAALPTGLADYHRLVELPYGEDVTNGTKQPLHSLSGIPQTSNTPERTKSTQYAQSGK
ncbi:MAG: hypothetical protein IJD40_15630 [Lachnospiraceae bacterium]|nr:hypothetical protein [Lachnospiraceae bacterium]